MLGIEFGALPPEINSARIYSGPGSAPLMQAAAAWERLAHELNTTAQSYTSVLSGLSTQEWLGPSSLSMAAAAAPYLAWMRATAAQAEQAAAQAQAAAGAYEAAHAATVPPTTVASNRSITRALAQTNIFGQNTPAIATGEADYGEMWAQDVVAMTSYAGHSEAAAQLPPFTPPPATTTESALALAAPAAPVADVADDIAEVLNALPNPFEDLDILVLSTAGLAGASLIVALGQFSEEVRSDEIEEEELAEGNELQQDQIFEGLGGGEPFKFDRGFATRLPGLGASALSGNAANLSGISVPQSWFMPPAVRQVAAMFPGTTPIVMSGESDGGYSAVAAAGLAGTSLAGFAARGSSSNPAQQPTTPATGGGGAVAATRPTANTPAIPAAAVAAQFPGLPQGLPPGVVANLAATLAAIPGATIIVVPPNPNQ